MTEDTVGTGPRPTRAVRKKRGRGVLWAFLAVVLAFLAGFGWQWYEATAVRDELAATRQELQIERLRLRLGQAAMAAQAGEYESARQQMSDFFTRLQEVAPALPDTLARVSGQLLDMRDDIITGLSRSDPEYPGILYDMLERFRSAAPGSGQRLAPAARPQATPEPAAPVQDTGAAQGAAGVDSVP